MGGVTWSILPPLLLSWLASIPIPFIIVTMNTNIRRAAMILSGLWMVGCMYFVLTDARAWNLWFAGFFVMGAYSFYLLLKDEDSSK